MDILFIVLRVSDVAPSNVAILGRYIINPGKGGEIQLTDALKELAKIGKMYAYDFKGKLYDVGNLIAGVLIMLLSHVVVSVFSRVGLEELAFDLRKYVRIFG